METIFFDAFGTLCEIKNRRNTYMPIIKAWPRGVADAYRALMTRNCLPAELAQEAGCSQETVIEIEESIAAEIDSMRLYPEVFQVLERISQTGIKWAIISNLAQPYAKPLLDLLPLKPDVCAWSFELACQKPEEGIYRYVCDKLNLEPKSVMMVGDSLENDYNAPKRLGMQARYLNRSNTDNNIPESIIDLTAILADI